jgi:hypothetical protein
VESLLPLRLDKLRIEIQIFNHASNFRCLAGSEPSKLQSRR